MHIKGDSFAAIYASLREDMIYRSSQVHTGTWQGRNISDLPEASMVELLNVTIECDLKQRIQLDYWRENIKPNLPWADEHFLERICGRPLNPPPSWVRWPWAKSASKFRQGERFNHTYPERYWPKFAGEAPFKGHQGIRGAYGDLDSVVELLVKDPLTRQAYLPIFFPEDTGIGDGGRKPCTLGYHFIQRDNLLHCFYPMRSCDLYRHFRDDVYLTLRLMMWVSKEVALGWDMGSLTMHMTSLHSFVGDVIQLRRETLTRALA